MTCHGSVYLDFFAHRDFLAVISWQATDKLFCRAINVSCLSKIHAYTIKSKQTELRQVMKKPLF